MRNRQRAVLLALSAAGVLVSGCFTMQPVHNVTPAPGTGVAINVNDAGRVALAPSMGRELDQIRGNLVRQDSDTYYIAVTSVDFLHGGTQTWTGEVVPIKSAYANDFLMQKFSAPRTIAAAAVIVTAAAVMTKQGLDAGSPPTTDGNPQPPPDVKQRSKPGLKIPLHPASTMRVVRHLWSALALHF